MSVTESTSYLSDPSSPPTGGQTRGPYTCLCLHLSPRTMSTAMNFGSKSFKPRAPDKGAFPLDHFGECKAFKEKFMQCLRDSSFDNSRCRLQSKEYLECRMENQLMAKEPLEKLGFKDLMDPPASQPGRQAKPEDTARGQ